MNTILLHPTDVLFFRDGRPMGGASTGHGAAWPLPTVTNAALHAALWRSGLAAQSHVHQRATGREKGDLRAERFGSLVTAGPFPVETAGAAANWYFPRPLDADCTEPADAANSLNPIKHLARPATPLSGASSSNPLPLAVAATVPPSKKKPAPWWSAAAWAAYLGTATNGSRNICSRRDADFSDTEAAIGIGIDAATGTQDGEHFYSAHYLRLREGWQLGLLAATAEKFADADRHGDRDDLIPKLLADGHRLLVGGQQRLCSATCQKRAGDRLPLPLGQTDGFPQPKIKHLVKWVLLSPAIFPAIAANPTKGIPAHSGGWLPTWIQDGGSYQVQLRAPLPPRDVKNESRARYRAEVQAQPFIAAQLVAALTGKPVPVTGWSLGTPDNSEAEARTAGAKSIHLAVPAGSVYYFACDTAAAATQLAAALNWHGDTPGTALRNRRSTLLGEKGFGLGVCAGWTPLDPV